ncbi:PA14 domain-containing protein [Flavobacterium sp. Arc3]|uniref:PA14 domain-containing protein n=1 Tax=Flavobacterium sp. Arc3 TaxID=3046686 RepID=UPI00352D5005
MIPFNFSGTFTVPCDVTSITVKVWGAGGGGDNSYNRGGGGGAFAQSTFSVSAGASYAVTVGAGGARGTGDNGEDSSFGSVVIAKGGNGGNGGSNPGRGGRASASTGDIVWNGGNGGTSTSTRGAGGGAAAGTTNSGNNGGNANSTTTGTGASGTNGGGSGGNGGTSGNGEDGFFPGGGGGERGTSSGSSGKGGNGRIEVTYTSSLNNYCTPSFNSGVEPITNVTFAGINKTTTNDLGGPSLEVFCSPTASVVRGSTNSISVQGNTGGNYTESIKVYIDWDKNGVYGNNANEKYDVGTITNSNGIDGGKATNNNIIVPLGASLGSTSMRVIKYYYNTSDDPCFSGSGYGQAEDYTVNVTSPCPTYIINSVSATNACMSGTSTAIISSTSTGLPIGNYTVTYNRSSPSATGLTATMTVSTAGTGSFSVTGLTTAGSSTITVTKLTLGSCETTFTGKTANLTVNANNTATVVFGSPNVCVGTAITAVTHTTTGATGIGAAAGLPAGVISSFTPNTITISGTPTASGIYDYSIPLTGGCGSVNATGTIIVSATNTAPTIGTRTQPTCTTATGSVVLNGLPPEWALTQYPGGTTTTGIGTSTTISGLSPNTYTYSVVDTRKGLKGEYFNNANFTGAPVLTRIDPRVDFNWGGLSPDASIPNDRFSVRWSGQVEPLYSQNYTFTTNSDDGVRLWVNGVKLIDDWNDHGPADRSGSITLTAGVKYNIVLEYYENAGGAVSRLSWSSPSQTSQIIPQSQLFPSAICGSPASADVVINAQPATLSVSTISSTAATCYAAGSTNISNYLASNAYTFTPTGPTVGAGGLVGGMTIGTSYTVTSKKGTCTSAASGSFSNAAMLETPERPTVGTITQPDCITPTGTVVLNGLPSSGTWDLYKTGVASPIVAGGSGTTYTVTGLTATTHTFTIKNSVGCTSIASVNVIINPAITNTWNGAWSDGTPTILQAIKFTEDYSVDAYVNGCSCIVTGSKNVIIKSGKTMKIVNEVKVLGSGTLTFENNASLVQINDNASNSGNIIYKRTTPEILKTDYVYWSSPVALAKLSAIQTGTLYYSFNGSGNSWVNANANTIMDTGKGYIVRGAGTWFDTGNITLTANFIGAPNNGEKVVTIVGAGKNNLIGNPYPSAIDGEAFLTANIDVSGGTTDFLEGALYFWTHKSAIQLASGIAPEKAGSGTYAYTSDDYSPFTKVGGTNSVTGYIAAGQSFFARGSTTGGQAKFVNSMRLDGDKILDNSGFLKSVSTSKSEKVTTTTKIEKSRIWLNLTNTQGAFKQVLLGYMTGATNSYDRGYDALSFNGNSFINFYSINNSSLLTIQGRALPIQENDAVPLGYSSTIAGDFSISIDKTDGALSTMAVYLEDRLTDTTHDLKKGAYTFTTETGTFNERFVLSYVDKVTLATNDFEVLENQVVITSKNNEIKINASIDYIDKVFVYDVTGKQIFLKSKIDKNEFIISNMGNTDQVLIVKVVLQNNSVVTKKIIF